MWQIISLSHRDHLFHDKCSWIEVELNLFLQYHRELYSTAAASDGLKTTFVEFPEDARDHKSCAHLRQKVEKTSNVKLIFEVTEKL